MKQIRRILSLGLIAALAGAMFAGTAMALPQSSYTADGITITATRVFEGHDKWLGSSFQMANGEVTSSVSTDGLLQYTASSSSENLIGFCTKNGTVVIPAQYSYDEIGAHFSNGLCGIAVYDPMTATSKWGYMDEHGNLVIAAQYDEAGAFNEGLAAVKINGKWGYINTSGQMVIPAVYDLAQNFGDGWAYVCESSGWKGYINAAGEKMMQVKQVPFDTGIATVMVDAYNGHYKFNDGYAVVLGMTADYTGELLLDKEGNLYPLGNVTVVDVYSDGLVPVTVNGKYGAMDASGKLVVPYLYDFMTRFDSGVAVVRQNNRYGVIDTKGNVVVPIEWASIEQFCNGVGTARYSHDSSAYNNQNGSYVLEVSGSAQTTEPTVPVQSQLSAKPTSATVLVNGTQVAFDAYSINGNNYFKLRDLAYVLNGTEKQFEVGYDAASKAITLTSGSAYTSVGGEMQSKGTEAKVPSATSSKITLDGTAVTFTAYMIDGNNYFKLRDIGEAFDFGVAWDEATRTIAIDTASGYTPE